MYTSGGEIYQLYTLFRSLPKLNYKIKVFDRKQPNFEDNLIKCEKTLHTVGYKRLARDLIGQLVSKGTVICMWMGNKSNPYLYVFDKVDYVFSPYRRNGESIAVFDLSYLDNMKDSEKERFYENFKEIKLKQNYAKYQKDREKYQYLELPPDKASVLRINTLIRNQRVGFPMGIQSLFDINHKKELRTLESNIVNKIIKSIAVLTIGDDKHEYNDINPSLRQKIISSVKTAIKKSANADGVPVSILPHFANLKFPDIDGTDVFDSDKKFDDINNSLSMDMGINPTLTGGNGSNFQSSKMNLDMLYTRIDMILEEIEPVFQKLFNIMLTKKLAENYRFEFIKGTPLTSKEELEVLQKLHAEGTSYKSIVDMLSTVSYTELINDSMREIEDMGLREVITPPKTSSTLSSEDSEGGRKGIDPADVTNPNTASSQDSGNNTDEID